MGRGPAGRGAPRLCLHKRKGGCAHTHTNTHTHTHTQTQGDSYPLIIRLEALSDEGREQGHTLDEVGAPHMAQSVGGMKLRRTNT